MLTPMSSSASDSSNWASEITQRTYENAALAGLMKMVDPRHKRILDVGSGAGANMKKLSESGHDLFGLTLSAGEAELCAIQGFPVVIADIAASHLPFADRTFDGVVLCHVLEHLANPVQVLESLRGLLRPEGAIYVALPNVLYYKQRWEFMAGRFRYTDTGIMDRTHLRFFDIESARALLADAGFRIVHEKVEGGVPTLGMRSSAPKFWRKIDDVSLRYFPGLFSYHVMFKAELA